MRFEIIPRCRVSANYKTNSVCTRKAPVALCDGARLALGESPKVQPRLALPTTSMFTAGNLA
jgi:hypothetical protein